MIRHPAILLALVAAVLSLPVALSARRLSERQCDLYAAKSQLLTTAADAERVIELRSRQQRVAEQRRPEQDVISRVNAVLDAVQIPAAHFGGLQPETDAALPGTGRGGPEYRQQSLRISLRQLKTSELGAFLGEWRATQELWTPTRIELTHARSAQAPDLYDVVLLVTATYITD
jgi:hypothetical protein